MANRAQMSNQKNRQKNHDGKSNNKSDHPNKSKKSADGTSKLKTIAQSHILKADKPKTRLSQPSFIDKAIIKKAQQRAATKDQKRENSKTSGVVIVMKSTQQKKQAQKLVLKARSKPDHKDKQSAHIAKTKETHILKSSKTVTNKNMTNKTRPSGTASSAKKVDVAKTHAAKKSEGVNKTVAKQTAAQVQAKTKPAASKLGNTKTARVSTAPTKAFTSKTKPIFVPAKNKNAKNKNAKNKTVMQKTMSQIVMNKKSANGKAVNQKSVSQRSESQKDNAVLMRVHSAVAALKAKEKKLQEKTLQKKTASAKPTTTKTSMTPSATRTVQKSKTKLETVAAHRTKPASRLVSKSEQTNKLSMSSNESKKVNQKQFLQNHDGQNARDDAKIKNKSRENKARGNRTIGRNSGAAQNNGGESMRSVVVSKSLSVGSGSSMVEMLASSENVMTHVDHSSFDKNGFNQNNAKDAMTHQSKALQKTSSSAKAGTELSHTAKSAIKMSRHVFKTGEFVVYPAHGVGQVVNIEEQEVAGFRLELFVVNFIKDKLTLRVPTAKAAQVGMRKIADEALMTRALDLLTGRARIKRTMWSRRAQEYESKINSGDLIAVSEVVRDLYRSETQPEQSYSERQLHEAALDRLARELMVVRGITDKESLNLIYAQLQKGPKRGKTLALEQGAVSSDVEEAA